MNRDFADSAMLLAWIEPTVETLDVRATESSWGQPGRDSFQAADSGS